MDGLRLGKPEIWRAAALLGILIAAVVGVLAWRQAQRPPIVRRVTIVLPSMPAGSPPVTIALLSDIHTSEPDMSPARLRQIVAQVNALKPDAIVAAGDFVSAHSLFLRPYPAAVSVAPLGGLHGPLGVYAVIGNHDLWLGRGKVRKELTRLGITVLDNWTARRAGPLAIGGVAQMVARPGEAADSVATLNSVGGGRVLVTHSPDNFARLPPNTGLMLAGHTHCGQIRLFGWAPLTNSRYGQRYYCGVTRERGNVLVVGAGLGTSIIPFRLGAPPDFWLVQVRPPAR